MNKDHSSCTAKMAAGDTLVFLCGVQEHTMLLRKKHWNQELEAVLASSSTYANLIGSVFQVRNSSCGFDFTSLVKIIKCQAKT